MGSPANMRSAHCPSTVMTMPPRATALICWPLSVCGWPTSLQLLVDATRCVRIYKKLRDPDQTSSALNTLAGINLAANHPRQAEKHILQALRYASRANNRPRQAVINGMASEIYYKLGNYQRSLQYAQKAYVIDSLLGNEGKMAVRLTMQGAALGGMKRDDEAVAVYQKLFPRSAALAISTPSASLSTKWVLSF